MTTDKGIQIKNIFYMLSYAFRLLNQSNYDQVRAEEFEDAEDLFAAVLSRAVARQVKHGLYREYRTRQESLSLMRGKLAFPETIGHQIRHQQRLSCEFDELTENNRLNQILKTTLLQLLRCPKVQKKRQLALKQLLVRFGAVDTVRPETIAWEKLQLQQSSRDYRILLELCRLVQGALLPTTEAGSHGVMGLTEENMAWLYETFILEYYRRHHTYLTEVRAGQIPWNLQGNPPETMTRLLPRMQTDVMLRLGEQVLVIDAKYYGEVLQQQFSKYSLHSANLYQIFTYVKNLDRNQSGQVSGVLLYARTREALQPDCEFNMGGSRIGAQTLDLNRSFPHIARQLDQLAFHYFGVHDLS